MVEMRVEMLDTASHSNHNVAQLCVYTDLYALSKISSWIRASVCAWKVWVNMAAVDGVQDVVDFYYLFIYFK